MNLKTRLSFLYGLSVFIILVVSAITIYVLNENFRRNEFSKRLVAEAKENERLFYNLPKLSPQITQQLEQNANSGLQNQEISVYDPFFHLVYSTKENGSANIPLDGFFAAKKTGQFNFDQGEQEGILLHQPRNGTSYFILVSASDFFGRRKSDNLKIILLSCVAGGILLSGFGAFLYVRQAMKPLEELKGQIEKINEENLTERISVSRRNNEVRQIAKKFNEMLDRLEHAFEQRKNFVHHASHELRTPLANMLSQTESALNRKLSEEDYKQTLYSLKEEQQDMIELTNALLTLSRYEKITATNDWLPVRIDEALYEAVDSLRNAYPGSVATIDFEPVPENEDVLVFRSNESLIKSALQNLLKNAVQYSEDAKVRVIIGATETGILLHFDNNGEQLSDEERKRLFIPFFRGGNSLNKKGYGLGLSIVERIIRVHNGRISYHTIAGNINRFTVFLPS